MNSGNPRVCVVFVPGLWMTGWDMALLRRRIRRCGFTVQQFTYTNMRHDVAMNAARLHQFVLNLDADTIHFVGHSLGGLIIRQFLHTYADLEFNENEPALYVADFRPSGRVVTIATPHNGSCVAAKMARLPLLRYLLGRSFINGLDGQLPRWKSRRELGVIAGSVNIGAGRLIASLAGIAGDGTVTLSETRLDGMTDHIILAVSHTGCLLSAEVAKQICVFLRQGGFDH